MTDGVSLRLSKPVSAHAARHVPRPVAVQLLRFGNADTTSFQRKTKIVATLGPKSDGADMVRSLIAAGVDVFRLNFSHGTQEDHAGRIRWIRDGVSQLIQQGVLKRPVSILADVQGPKIRVGHFASGAITLKKGMKVSLSREMTSDQPHVIPVTFPQMIDALEPGQRILMDDGKLELRVVKAAVPGADQVLCTVVRGGVLKNSKGINLPHVKLNTPALSDKDKSDLAFALSQGVDKVALSFVRSAQDVLAAKAYIQSLGYKTQVFAKLEKPEVFHGDNLRQIIAAADGVMVARGDLGIEVDVVQLPWLQEKIIREAKHQGKPVIVATQMLESMMTSTVPSRAEVSDIADAVKDQADMVMLSGETAMGDYPVEAVQMMSRIIDFYEPRRNAKPSLMQCVSRLAAYLVQMLKRLWSKLTGLFSRP